MENENQNQSQENQEQTQNEGVEKVEMTKADLEKLLQSEGDKRVTSAMQKAQAKWEAEFKQKLEAEKSEAEKLAKMSEEEKMKAELEKEKAKFEEERKQFMIERLELETVKQLSSLELPTEFAKFVLGADAESTKANIDTFAGQWQKAIETAVDKKLQGHTPKASNGNVNAMTKQEFLNKPYNERLAIMNNNPDLYKQIMG
ncbi:DUF4355 domain-containing protein [Bacillus sp. UNC41MFS5]|uniref:DUF4355 domain-containing protein n=1 Tax=Bacillus sp. UNC41MFS5 TaxID=1449046 RepID=UPI00068F6173|nr:DUF4355 domain-containing protein [Bacillus sp. UNC41MFS5]